VGPAHDTVGAARDAVGPAQETGGAAPAIEGAPQEAGSSIADQAAELATEVTEAEQPEERRRLTAAFAAAARSGARATGRGVRAARRRAGTGTGWFTAQVVAMAPRLRVRNGAALRAQFPGKNTEDIADALIVGASRASGAVGAAVGA